MNNSNIPDRSNPLTYVLSNVQWFFPETLLTGRSWDTGGERPLTRVGWGANSIYYRMPPDLAMPAAPTHPSQLLSNVTNQKNRAPHYRCLVCYQPQLCSLLMASRHVLPCPSMSFHVLACPCMSRCPSLLRFVNYILSHPQPQSLLH